MKALLLALFTSALSLLSAAEEKPNFVVVLVDDMGYADVGCFGSPDIRTPVIDGLAEQGMRFTHFYAQHICGPSRAALMTGCQPIRLAELGNRKAQHPILHSEEITVAEILKDAGYATGCFGKWDLATHNQKAFKPLLMPNHQGFDVFFGTPSSNDRFIDVYRNEKLVEANADMNELTRQNTDEVIRFIADHKDSPFFAYVPYSMVHTRLGASETFRGNSPRGIYGDAVEEIDFSCGRMIEAIKQHGLADDTYFLFTSDNGPWLIKNEGFRDGSTPADHGGSAGPLRSGKVSTWEGGVRVPTVLWAPGRVPAGTTCDAITATIDILPTFARLAGAEPPRDRVIDGIDISPLFHGDFEQADPDRHFAYYFINSLQAVRQGKWKLHLPRPARPEWLGRWARNQHVAPEDWIGFDEPFLVDLETDPGETKSVAADHPEVVATLMALAEEIRNDAGDHDRIGTGMRFFDEGPIPDRPDFYQLKPAAKKPKSK